MILILFKQGTTRVMDESIEALYTNLGYSEKEKRNNALNLDKYYGSIYSHERIQFSIIVNLRNVALSLSDTRSSDILIELSHWHKKKKFFTLLQGVTLFRNIRILGHHLSMNKICLHSSKILS